MDYYSLHDYMQGSAQNLLRSGKKGQNSLYFCHFSIEERWLKWLGGGKCRPVWAKPCIR